ncbi:hypothetical protein ACFE04_013046 [Oxalis oulophora]
MRLPASAICFQFLTVGVGVGVGQLERRQIEKTMNKGKLNAVDRLSELSDDLNKRRQPVWSQLDSGCLDFDVPTYSQNSHRHYSMSGISLSIGSIKISGETLESILIDCPKLEALSVTYSISLQSFKLYSLSLKNLTLWLCGDDRNPVDFNITAPNLFSFAYAPYNNKTNLLLLDVPPLKKITTFCPCCDFQSHHLSQLQEIVWHIYQHLPELKSTQYLEHRDHLINLVATVPFNITVVCFLLTSCSFAGKFNARLEKEGGKGHHYNNLKSVKFIGLMTTNGGDEVMKYFINRAPPLEKIIIDPC